MNAHTIRGSSNKVRNVGAQARAIPWQHLPHHTFCAGVGILGGATGVALAIGATIMVQALLPLVVAFYPSAIVLTLMAAMLGLGVSWLLGQGAHRLCPRLFCNCTEQSLQVLLTFSVFTSLLETFLFMYSL